MCSGVAFQVKCIVKPFSTEGAQITFCVGVAFHVPIQQSLKAERLRTHSALKL